MHFSRLRSITNQRITVSVIGAGGTGSLLLQQLARINAAMVALGKKGIYLRCFDDDKVTEANKGRQLFTDADIGYYKAEVLLSRINLFYGFDWDAYYVKVQAADLFIESNVIFICVDNIKTRKDIYNMYLENTASKGREFQPFYIIDAGNTKSTGQVFLSTVGDIIQPKSKYEVVRNINSPIEQYGEDVYGEEDLSEPSCSLAEALNHQDIMINPFMAIYQAKFFRDLVFADAIDYKAMFINLDDMTFQKKML